MMGIIIGLLFFIPSIAVEILLGFLLSAPNCDIKFTLAIMFMFGCGVVSGLYFIILGIKGICHKHSIIEHGFDTYGVLANSNIKRFVKFTRGGVHESMFLYGDIRVLGEDGEIYKYIKNLGDDLNKYHVGDVLHVKHYKNDIELLDIVNADSLPSNIKDALGV